MVGSLARWLRILGFDVVYDVELDDPSLVDLSVREDRIILTRDRGLIERRRARNHLLIESDDLDRQLLQVLSALRLDTDAERVLGRCVRCNVGLDPVAAEIARPLVPTYVARTQDSFFRCPQCERIYWPATHVERMRQRLRDLGVEGV